MKNKKIVLSIFLVMILMFLLTGCSVFSEPSESWVTEDDLVYENYDKFVTIYGLSSTGKQKKDIVIPSSIDGVPVEGFGRGTFFFLGYSMGKFESVKLEKMFLQSDIDICCSSMYAFCPFLTKIIYVSTDISSHNAHLCSFDSAGETIPDAAFLYFYSETNTRTVNIRVDSTYDPRFYSNFADLQYNYNYEDSPNSGVYWLDDYDDELISYIPVNPEREGFIFLGWYTDAECTNEWDFSSDRIPKKIYEFIDDDDSDDAYTNYNYYYNKTELYAKWLSR